MKNLLVILIVLLISFPGKGQTSPVFVGHRGASYLAPENTIASYLLAWELGVSAAECDIMLTKDKQLIVFHDYKGKRLTGVDFEVKTTNYDDIRNLPIKLKETNLDKYKGQTIPLLEDLLATIPPGRTLVIEIKTGPEIMPYLEPVILQHWKSGNIAFIAFDYDAIVAAKKSFPDVPCYYLSSFRADINKRFEEIAESKLDGVNLRYKIIDKKLVDKFKAVNKDVWCWTVNDPEDAKNLIADGVSAITTDRPKWLKEAVN